MSGRSAASDGRNCVACGDGEKLGVGGLMSLKLKRAVDCGAAVCTRAALPEWA